MCCCFVGVSGSSCAGARLLWMDCRGTAGVSCDGINDGEGGEVRSWVLVVLSASAAAAYAKNAVSNGERANE